LSKQRRFTFWTLFVAAMALQSSAAHAYIDPGAGSMMLQAAVGAVAGGMFFIRTYWARFAGYFGRTTEADSNTKSSNAESEASISE